MYPIVGADKQITVLQTVTIFATDHGPTLLEVQMPLDSLSWSALMSLVARCRGRALASAREAVYCHHFAASCVPEVLAEYRAALSCARRYLEAAAASGSPLEALYTTECMLAAGAALEAM